VRPDPNNPLTIVTVLATLEQHVDAVLRESSVEGKPMQGSAGLLAAPVARVPFRARSNCAVPNRPPATSSSTGDGVPCNSSVPGSNGTANRIPLLLR